MVGLEEVPGKANLERDLEGDEFNQQRLGRPPVEELGRGLSEAVRESATARDEENTTTTKKSNIY